MTLISWTDITDNVIVVKGGGWWCRRVSDGCNNCYAATLNKNTFFGGNQLDYSGQPPELILKTNILESWTRQTKSKRHFVASMTDVFGEWIVPNWHYQILDAMRNAPRQTFQILTKRPDVMRSRCKSWLERSNLTEMPRNIWVGTTCEDQKTADKRIPMLLEIPALVKFLSCEPLLEKILLDENIITKLSWVIIGGESGSKARPCHIDWVRSLAHQCHNNGVPAFVKQLGTNPIVTVNFTDGTVDERYPFKTTNKKNDVLADFPIDLRVREFPINARV